MASAMSTITEEDLAFFRRNGYVRVRGAAPKENCERVIQEIWEFTGKSPEDREGWYSPPEGMTEFWGHQSGGMVEMYHHQALWDNRQHPRLHQAFAGVLGTKELWVSMDRVNMTPPGRADHPELDSYFVHWDTDTSELPSPLPRPHGVQGVLYLADTSEDQGGFHCVPSIYRDLEEWIKSQPSGRDPRTPDVGDHKVRPIPGEAGDLIIWDRLLPHGNGHNDSDEPRFAQYITMSPAHPEKIEARQPFIESWRTRDTPPGFPGDPRGWEKEHGRTAELTPLGRKLLGVDPW
jgi:hypothetical protein